MITPKGLEELRIALAQYQVGFILERLELLAFWTTFDPVKRTGQVAMNNSIIDRDKLKRALEAMREAFAAGFCVSDLVATAHAGEKLGDVVIPEGQVGFATMCSAVINGVLLKSGVPMDSKFGGIMEMRSGEPRRFVAIINYAGTSLDPSEAYIRARMTSVRQAAATGTGRILANFREIPASSRPVVEGIVADLKRSGIGGVLLIGEASEPLCQMPVGLNKIGMVLLGGLNPVAAAEEAGLGAENISGSGTIDFRQLVSYHEL
jgi:repressor of nif and glnA expression